MMFDTREDLFREGKQREYRQLYLILVHVTEFRESVAIQKDGRFVFRHGEFSLMNLSSSLETLLYHLQEIDNAWRDRYEEYFWPIFLAYEYFIIDKKTHLSEKELQEIDCNLSGIEQMVKERIKLYEPYLDDADCY